ncbi:MAG: NAD-dependent epimerase/dehydratase family protein, partial [Phycisphaeraceae bacterium]
MAHGYVYETRPTQTNQNEPRKVFVTGAGGRIGSEFARRMKDRYDLTLMVHPDKDPGRVEGCGRIVRATLENRDELTSLFKNHDAVVHLAANPAPDAGWQSVLDNNIRGTYHAMAAADAA